MATSAHNVAVDRPDPQHTTSVRMRTQDTPLKLQEMQLMRLASCIHAVPELRCDVQYQEMPDEVHVEVRLGSVPANAEVNRWRLGVLISLNSAELELHEVVNGAARGCFIRNVLQAVERSCAGGNGLEYDSWNHSEAWGGQEPVDPRKRSSRMNLNEVPGPRTTSQTDQVTSTECARNQARRGKLCGVGGVLAVYQSELQQAIRLKRLRRRH